MTFPESKFIDTKSYFDAYFSKVSEAAATIDRERIEQAAGILTKVYTVGGIVYSYGNRGDYQTVEILGDTFNYSG